MKKALLTALLALIITPLFAGGAYAETLSEKAAGATGATAAEQALPESVRGISGRIETDGQYDAPGALERLWRKMLDTAAQEIKGNLQSASALAAIALCTALASSLSPGGTAQGYISIAGVGAAAALLVGSVDSLAVQTVSALGLMSDYSRAALPAVFTAAAACGAVVSASARYAAVCIAIDVLMAAAQKFVIPLVYAYLALALCGALFENPLLKTCQRFSKWLATTFMTAFTIAFSGYIGLTGIVTSGVDAVAVKTARTVISTTLPVVGGIISDAASTVLSAASMIRNSAGALSLVAVCALCAEPFVKLSVKILLFRAAAAVCDMVPNAKLSSFVNDVGSALSILLGLVGCCAIMLFISFTAAIKVVTA